MGGTSKFRTVCVYIIGTELMERLAYYSLAYNLVLFFTRELQISTDVSDSMVTLFASLVMVFSLLGGYVSDVYLGRYRTILWFSSLYLLAIGTCAIAAAPPVRSAPLSFVALFFVAIAAGGIKPNVSTLGADQYDTSDPAQALEKASFFNSFYFAINCGATFAVGFSYISQNGLGSAIPREWGFTVSWAVPAAGFAVAIVLFVSRAERYVRVPPSGSAVVRLVRVVTAAAARGVASPADGSKTGWGGEDGNGAGDPCARWLVRGIVAAVPGVLLLMVSLVGEAGSVERVGCSMAGTICVLACLGAMACLSLPVADTLLRHADQSGPQESSRREVSSGPEVSSELRGTPLAASLLESDGRADECGDAAADRRGASCLLAHNGSSFGGAASASGLSSSWQDTLDCAAVLRLMPFLSLVSFYWTLYSAMAPTFVNQGCQMVRLLIHARTLLPRVCTPYQHAFISLTLLHSLGYSACIPGPALRRW